VSAFGDAMKAVREVLLLQSRVDALQRSLAGQADDLKGLSQNVIDVDRRVAQIEGYIRGRADQASAQSQTPRIEG
jgi:phage shock protein A